MANCPSSNELAFDDATTRWSSGFLERDHQNAAVYKPSCWPRGPSTQYLPQALTNTQHLKAQAPSPHPTSQHETQAVGVGERGVWMRSLASWGLQVGEPSMWNDVLERAEPSMWNDVLERAYHMNSAPENPTIRWARKPRQEANTCTQGAPKASTNPALYFVSSGGLAQTSLCTFCEN